MRLQNQQDPALRIVIFDAGGPGCISQLYMMREIMRRIEFKKGASPDTERPMNYFDLIGGTGFGAYCALMLGRLGMTPDEALKELLLIGQAVFADNGDNNKESRGKTLEAAVTQMLERNGFPADMNLYDPSVDHPTKPGCRVVVFSVSGFTMADPWSLRSYRMRKPITLSTFVETACITMVDRKYFTPMNMDPLTKEGLLNDSKFAGVPLGLANPIQLVIQEVRLTFGKDARMSLIISLGSGKERHLGGSDPRLVDRLLDDRGRIATGAERKHPNADTYLRLDVDSGMDGIQLHEWDKSAHITGCTDIYMRRPDISRGIDSIVEILLPENDQAHGPDEIPDAVETSDSPV